MKTTILIILSLISLNSMSNEIGFSLDKTHKENGFTLSFNQFNFYKSSFDSDFVSKNSIGLSYKSKFENKFLTPYIELGIEKRETTTYGSTSYNGFLVNNYNTQEKDTTTSNTDTNTTSKTSLKLGAGLEKSLKITNNFSLSASAGVQSFNFKAPTEFKTSIGISFSF